MVEHAIDVCIDYALYCFCLYFIHRVDGTIEESPGNTESDMKPGDNFVMEAPGSGAYGGSMYLGHIFFISSNSNSDTAR